MKNMVEFFGVK